MKVKVLICDSAREGFIAEHGLSLYIETATAKILFDFGQSDAFSSNAERTGADLSKVDFAVLSHDHYDHGGGIEKFFGLNHAAEVFAANDIFGMRYSRGGSKYAGIDLKLKGDPRFIPVGKTLELRHGINLGSLEKKDEIYPFSSDGLFTLKDFELVPDDFSHERYLIIQENGKRVLVSGCSHKGILNIANRFRPDVFIGGFHLGGAIGKYGEEYVLNIARRLGVLGGNYFTMHCTGDAEYRLMKTVLGEKLNELKAGEELNTDIFYEASNG